VTRARASGAPITAETCPHYLSIAAEDIADGAVELKCAPPIRAAAERERLWRGLADGTIELVASDHSPAPPELKRAADGDFLAAWGGIASLQVALAVVWTEARARGFGLERLAGWCSAAPARLAGLASRKGSIAPGRDADLVVFDPEASFTVEPERLYHRHPMTPYAGRTLAGRIVRTYLRGALVYDDGRFAAPAGELLRR
jgi:allantoinase